ncbi:hypothetical protein K0M31_019182 [Melipona bicolor]|uniref:Uncharacterized protein n=1 Tax=Melipona bicolor TaxID=60889 RepID=A0AA40G2T7_9HYME|nr:hypothetical protein K0M31_019182 [Melipona bicolor]
MVVNTWADDPSEFFDGFVVGKVAIVPPKLISFSRALPLVAAIVDAGEEGEVKDMDGGRVGLLKRGIRCRNQARSSLALHCIALRCVALRCALRQGGV